MNAKFDLPHDIGQVAVSLIVEGADPPVPGTRKRKKLIFTSGGSNGIPSRFKLPLGLHKQRQDAFRCSICCCSPIKPPVVFGRCCKRLLGCQDCVDRWFGGEDGVTRSCPLCRTEQAYVDTCILKGLDELLTSISPLMSSSTEDSDREDSPIQQ